MFDGKILYDAAAFKHAAETLRAKSGDVLIAEFPQGSFGGTSAAKAEIGQFPAEFATLAHHVATLASALSATADRAPDKITDDMRMKSGAERPTMSAYGSNRRAAA